jgi:hypothetical protein
MTLRRGPAPYLPQKGVVAVSLAVVLACFYPSRFFEK